MRITQREDDVATIILSEVHYRETYNAFDVLYKFRYVKIYRT